jgi:hypothetical protein
MDALKSDPLSLLYILTSAMRVGIFRGALYQVRQCVDRVECSHETIYGHVVFAATGLGHGLMSQAPLFQRSRDLVVCCGREGFKSISGAFAWARRSSGLNADMQPTVW